MCTKSYLTGPPRDEDVVPIHFTDLTAQNVLCHLSVWLTFKPLVSVDINLSLLYPPLACFRVLVMIVHLSWELGWLCLPWWNVASVVSCTFLYCSSIFLINPKAYFGWPAEYWRRLLNLHVKLLLAIYSPRASSRKGEKRNKIIRFRLMKHIESTRFILR